MYWSWRIITEMIQARAERKDGRKERSPSEASLQSYVGLRTRALAAGLLFDGRDTAGNGWGDGDDGFRHR